MQPAAIGKGVSNYFSHTNVISEIENSNHLSSRIAIFEKADLPEREFLVNLAVESNDIYHTRKADISVAQMVFAIEDAVFNKGTVEVLKLDGNVVGFYTLKVHNASEEGFEHELGHLFVKAGLQRNGYGTQLFQRAIAVARERGWEKLEWFCDPDASEFYLKLGATIFDKCENLLNPSVDLPIFMYSIKNTKPSPNVLTPLSI
jgi:GNAT superfamily N-acetyltransferase